MRWPRAIVSLVVLCGVLTSAWATCAEGATAPKAQQMACCKGGHHQCPMKNSASDCCRQSGPRVDARATLVKAATLVAPTAIPLTWLPALDAFSMIRAQRRIDIASSPPPRSGPPPSIAFSVLLI